MLRRVLQAERFRLVGDQAHKAFTQTQRGDVNGIALEAMGGEKFQRAIVAQHIERAHIGPHIVGDQIDDLVQPVLAGQRFGHGFAQLAQEHPRSTNRCHHVRSPGGYSASKDCHRREVITPRPCPDRNRYAEPELQALHIPHRSTPRS